MYFFSVVCPTDDGYICDILKYYNMTLQDAIKTFLKYSWDDDDSNLRKQVVIVRDVNDHVVATIAYNTNTVVSFIREGESRTYNWSDLWVEY